MTEEDLIDYLIDEAIEYPIINWIGNSILRHLGYNSLADSLEFSIWDLKVTLIPNDGLEGLGSPGWNLSWELVDSASDHSWIIWLLINSIFDDDFLERHVWQQIVEICLCSALCLLLRSKVATSDCDKLVIVSICCKEVTIRWGRSIDLSCSGKRCNLDCSIGGCKYRLITISVRDHHIAHKVTNNFPCA